MSLQKEFLLESELRGFNTPMHSFSAYPGRTTSQSAQARKKIGCGCCLDPSTDRS